ncbi:MAG: peptidylprolyl isomerase [Planctomycetota bacterium]|nr:peptidylprolyl isomerase [Planctomycetota bacterium]
MAILVNGERIDEKAVHEETERMRPQFEQAFADEAPATREARLQEWARENIIERTLLEQAAKADPHPVTPEEVDAAIRGTGREPGPDVPADVRANIELSLRARRLLDEAGKDLPPPTEEAVRKFYQENLKEFALPERVHAAHLVKHVTPCKPPEVCEEALRKAKEDLAAGADFAALAVKYSDCPENGGDLGWFALGRMVEDFENTVFKMKPGEVSDIFATRYGFHIVKVFDRKPSGPASLEEVDGYIRARLVTDDRNAAIEKFLDGLRAAAKVEDVT